ncbi:hypothetical protein [Streptomyces mesophilus]|uniref:hypothetical protein n=1 Tax=Streptomyces mesophilus TaxID=1775132 RepID=UPI00332988BB
MRGNRIRRMRRRLVGVPLGTDRAPSLPPALWWLRERAAWIAERFDLTPDTLGADQSSGRP